MLYTRNCWQFSIALQLPAENLNQNIAEVKKISFCLFLFLLYGCGRAQDQDCCPPALFSQVIAAVQDNHIRPLPIDDSLSAAVFHHFISQMEEEEGLLTAEEADQLSAYQFSIDDDMLNGTNLFLEAAFALLSADGERKRKSKAEWYQALINSYLAVNDYQSSFLSPTEKAKWDAAYHRSLVGTGIRFDITDTHPRIAEVFPDGPGWKTGRIKTGALLLGISTEDGGFIDFAGMPGEEVGSYLRGKPGSTAIIKVRQPGGETEQVAITRERYALSRARAWVLEGQPGQPRVGYIRLPRFYAGEQGCAADVLANLRYLNEEGVEGILFDVRDNQGGSSREAVELIGYFLRGGPVMQARYADGRHRVLEDEDSTAQYSGPLIVLANENSSSASELMAATLQQCGRALIVGSQTYGKGTIQQFFALGNNSHGQSYGDVKLTIGAFYAGKGYATQYRGVIPDIALPTENRYLPTGERKVENALQFSHLPEFESSRDTASLEALRRKSLGRQEKSEYFQAVEKLALKKKHGKEKDQEQEAPAVRGSPGRRLGMIWEEQPSERLKAYWEDKVLTDYYLFESYLIMNDYLELELKEQEGKG